MTGVSNQVLAERIDNVKDSITDIKRLFEQYIISSDSRHDSVEGLVIQVKDDTTKNSGRIKHILDKIKGFVDS